MSAEARSWAKRQRLFIRPGKRDVSAGDVLRELADFADAEGCAWPKVATLVDVIGLTARAVQDALRRLEAGGLVERTGRTAPRNRNVPIYRLVMEAEFDGVCLAEKGAAAAPLADAKGAAIAPQGVQPLHPRGAAAAPPIGTTIEQEGTDVPTPGAREVDPRSAFDRARAAYPEAGLIAPKLDRAAWRRALERGHDAEVLVEACARYGRSPGQWGATGRPCAFHRFLDEDRCELFAPTGEAADAVRARTRFAGPPELREAFVAAHGEDRAASWLDPCVWRDPGGLVARNSVAADRLRELLRGQAWAADLTVSTAPACAPAGVG